MSSTVKGNQREYLGCNKLVLPQYGCVKVVASECELWPDTNLCLCIRPEWASSQARLLSQNGIPKIEHCRARVYARVLVARTNPYVPC